MKIRSGASAQGRSIEIELDTEKDVPDYWKEYTTAKKFTKLSAMADTMVVSYLLDNHLIPSEVAQSRLSKLQKVLSD